VERENGWMRKRIVGNGESSACQRRKNNDWSRLTLPDAEPCRTGYFSSDVPFSVCMLRRVSAARSFASDSISYRHLIQVSVMSYGTLYTPSAVA